MAEWILGCNFQLLNFGGQIVESFLFILLRMLTWRSQFSLILLSYFLTFLWAGNDIDLLFKLNGDISFSWHYMIFVLLLPINVSCNNSMFLYDALNYCRKDRSRGGEGLLLFNSHFINLNSAPFWFQESERAVSRDEGLALAKEHGCLFFECSAKTRENVEECFEKLALKVPPLSML